MLTCLPPGLLELWYHTAGEDEECAVKRANAYIKFRASKPDVYANLTIDNERMDEMNGGGVRVLDGETCSGRKVALVVNSMMDWHGSLLEILQMQTYNHENLIRDREAQGRGLVIVQDMGEFTLSQIWRVSERDPLTAPALRDGESFGASFRNLQAAASFFKDAQSLLLVPQPKLTSPCLVRLSDPEGCSSQTLSNSESSRWARPPPLPRKAVVIFTEYCEFAVYQRAANRVAARMWVGCTLASSLDEI